MKLTIIAAIGKNNELGKNNDLINLQEMDRNECIKTFEEYKKQNGVIY